jgi:hypothetical protein
MSKNTFVKGASLKKPLKDFKYINTRMNHVELNEIVNDKDVVESSFEELFELSKSDQYQVYNKDSEERITRIQTIDNIYMVKSDYMTAVNEFELNSGIFERKLDWLDQKELSEFIWNGTHYTNKRTRKSMALRQADPRRLLPSCGEVPRIGFDVQLQIMRSSILLLRFRIFWFLAIQRVLGSFCIGDHSSDFML